MQQAMESCPAKTAMSGVMGFGLGGLFGLFMSSVSFTIQDHSKAHANLILTDALRCAHDGDRRRHRKTPRTRPSATRLQRDGQGKLEQCKELWSRWWHLRGNRVLYRGRELVRQYPGAWIHADKNTQFRAKNDLYNGVAAGCITGGALAAKAGPQAAAFGCAGFAAFSAAIDYYMRMPSDDPAADPIA